MALRLSGRDSNPSRPSMLLPAALFPAPDRPSSTRRSSGEDEGEGDSANEEGEAGEGNKAGEGSKVGDEEEEKTGEGGEEVGDASGDLSSKLFILW